MRPEDRALLQRLRKNQPELLEALKQKHFEEFQVKQFTKAKAGLSPRLVESVVDVEEPEKAELWEVCSTCASFIVSEGTYISDETAGKCERDSTYALASARACEHWERKSSKGKSSESAGKVRSLIESARERTKTLMSMF